MEQKRFCFEITFGTGTNPHLFSALNEGDKQDWIKLFRKCVKVMKIITFHGRDLFFLSRRGRKEK